MTITDWRARAACAGAVTSPDNDVFFQADEQATATALAYCGACPVKADCRIEYQSLETRVGVWAGIVANEPVPPAPRKPHTTLHTTPEQNERRIRLHADGWPDADIALDQGVTTRAIAVWRANRGLPVNTSPYKGRNQTVTIHRLDLYHRGLTDAQIAFEENKPIETIRAWRWRRKLPVNDGRLS